MHDVVARAARVLDRVLSAVLVVALALPVWRFLSSMPGRLSYPWELEWMEGGIVSHIEVVLSGEPLYRAPSLDFTPFIYTPFYIYVSSVVSKLAGVGYFAPRLVSAVSIVVCFGLLFWWVWRETRDLLAAWAAVGIFAGTYALTGFWFDIARADSLLLLCLLSGCILARFGTNSWTLAGAGVALTLAFFTKQTALGLAGPVLLGAALRVPRRGYVAAATFIVLVGIGIAVFNAQSDGWFWFYVFHLPSQHAVAWEQWRAILVDTVWPSIAPMVLAGIAVACGVASANDGWRGWPALGLFVLVAGLTSGAALLHTGGYPNVLIPALAALALATGLVVARMRRGHGPSRLARRLLVTVLVLLQLGLLSFGGADARPAPGDKLAGAELIRRLAALPGPMWCTSSSYYPTLAGQTKRMTHTMGLVDVFKSTNELAKARLLAQLSRDLASGRVRTIVLDRAAGFLPDAVVNIIHDNYHFSFRLFGPHELPRWPQTGAGVRPEEVWSANAPAPTGAR